MTEKSYFKNIHKITKHNNYNLLTCLLGDIANLCMYLDFYVSIDGSKNERSETNFIKRRFFNAKIKTFLKSDGKFLEFPVL